jgi:hypothetical protein
MPPGNPGGNENGDSSLQQYGIVAKMMATAHLPTRRREANHSIRMALSKCGQICTKTHLLFGNLKIRSIPANKLAGHKFLPDYPSWLFRRNPKLP